MKLAHDIEHDLEHTIPPEGGPDSRALFRAMTARSLALVAGDGPLLDCAAGMGQDTAALAAAAPPGSLILGLEPSDRMIRYAQFAARRAAREVGEAAQGEASAAHRLVRSLAEELPLTDNALGGVLCKGAMDHFMDPALAMNEFARVLRPGGRAVLSIANYDSLACRLGRWRERRRARRPGYVAEPHPWFEPPPDHMTRFGFRTIMALVAPPMRLERVEGISALWGFPPWGMLLAALPRPAVRALLALAFAVGRFMPALADVIVVRAVKEG